MTTTTTCDLSRYPCATFGCEQPAAFVRQTSHPTAFYGECAACHERIERDLATRAERDNAAQDRRKQQTALVDRQPTWALNNMIRALTIFEALNSDEENERLRQARCEVRRRRTYSSPVDPVATAPWGVWRPHGAAHIDMRMRACYHGQQRAHDPCERRDPEW